MIAKYYTQTTGYKFWHLGILGKKSELVMFCQSHDHIMHIRELISRSKYFFKNKTQGTRFTGSFGTKSRRCVWEGGHLYAVFAFLKSQPTAIPFTPSKFASLSNRITREKLLRVSSISRVATNGLSGFGSAIYPEIPRLSHQNGHKVSVSFPRKSTGSWKLC